VESISLKNGHLYLCYLGFRDFVRALKSRIIYHQKEKPLAGNSFFFATHLL
jgi:hypothetical protein